MENGTHEQIVTHLKREFELNGLEYPEELQVNVESHYATNTNAEGPKPTCHHCKKPAQYGNQCPLLNKEKQVEGTQTTPGNKNSGAKKSIPSNNNNRDKSNKNSKRAERKLKTVYPRCETCGKTNHSTEGCYVRADAAKKQLPWKGKPEVESGHHHQHAQTKMTACFRDTAQRLN